MLWRSLAAVFARHAARRAYTTAAESTPQPTLISQNLVRTIPFHMSSQEAEKLVISLVSERLQRKHAWLSASQDEQIPDNLSTSAGIAVRMHPIFWPVWMTDGIIGTNHDAHSEAAVAYLNNIGYPGNNYPGLCRVPIEVDLKDLYKDSQNGLVGAYNESLHNGAQDVFIVPFNLSPEAFYTWSQDEARSSEEVPPPWPLYSNHTVFFSYPVLVPLYVASMVVHQDGVKWRVVYAVRADHYMNERPNYYCLGDAEHPQYQPDFSKVELTRRSRVKKFDFFRMFPNPTESLRTFIDTMTEDDGIRASEQNQMLNEWLEYGRETGSFDSWIIDWRASPASDLVDLYRLREYLEWRAGEAVPYSRMGRVFGWLEEDSKECKPALSPATLRLLQSLPDGTASDTKISAFQRFDFESMMVKHIHAAKAHGMFTLGHGATRFMTQLDTYEKLQRS